MLRIKEQPSYFLVDSDIYEGRSKSSQESAIIFLFCKSAESNHYSYTEKQDLYSYTAIFAALLTVIAMETVQHKKKYWPTFVHFCKKSMFNDDVAFASLPIFFHQTLYEQSSMCLQ